jgi:hypothetical protein
MGKQPGFLSFAADRATSPRSSLSSIDWGKRLEIRHSAPASSIC